MGFNIHCVPILKDNYCWLIGNTHNNGVYILDPGEALPLINYLDKHNLQPLEILLTHKHPDHTLGISELKERFKLEVRGPDGPGYNDIEHFLIGGECLELWPGLELDVVFTPGHTENHLCYLSRETTPRESNARKPQQRLFCGDTLFSAGCGRLLGGTAEQLKQSLDWIKSLDSDTLAYCSHEYTQANLKFANTVEPENPSISEYIDEIQALRKLLKPSLPTKIMKEKQINPFFRCDQPEIQGKLAQKFGQNVTNELSAFILLRRWKDAF